MQNISILISPISPSGFTDIKKLNVLHHPMQSKNLHFNPQMGLIEGFLFYGESQSNRRPFYDFWGMACAKIAAAASHMHFIHVVEFFRHVPVPGNQLSPCYPFSHHCIVAASTIIRIVWPLSRICKKWNVAIWIAVAIAERDVNTSSSVTLNRRLKFGLNWGEWSWEEAYINIWGQVVIQWSFVSDSVWELKVQWVSMFESR